MFFLPFCPHSLHLSLHVTFLELNLLLYRLQIFQRPLFFLLDSPDLLPQQVLGRLPLFRDNLKFMPGFILHILELELMLFQEHRPAVLKLVHCPLELVDILLVGAVLRIYFLVQLGFLRKHLLHFGKMALEHLKFSLVVKLYVVRVRMFQLQISLELAHLRSKRVYLLLLLLVGLTESLLYLPYLLVLLLRHDIDMLRGLKLHNLNPFLLLFHLLLQKSHLPLSLIFFL